MTEKLPAHENVRVAFSDGWTRTAQKKLIAFANTLGGDLYLGLNEEGTATGLSKKDAQRISRALHTFCAEETEPAETTEPVEEPAEDETTEPAEDDATDTEPTEGEAV